VLADVVVVDSRDAALEAIRTNVPDVLLLSALLSPRDEDELIAHLRTLDAQHLQTHTIPQLASALEPGEKRGGGGLLSAFRRKKDAATVVSGCDPDLFAEEITTYLQRAEAKKRERRESNGTAPDMRLGRIPERREAAAVSEPEAEPTNESSWSSPFEWKPSAGGSARVPRPEPAHAAPAHSAPVQAESAQSEPAYAESTDSSSVTYETTARQAEPEPLIAAPQPVIRASHDPIGEPITVAMDGQQVVVQGEPSLLIPQPYSVLMSASEASQETSEPARIYEAEPLLTRPEPKHTLIDTGESGDLPDFTLVDDAVESAEPLRQPYAAAGHAADAAAETLINLDAEPYEASVEEPAYARSNEPLQDDSRDSATPVSEWGAAIEAASVIDQGMGAHRLGPLATWARLESRRSDSPSTSDDLRMLLGSLAVPPAVAGVRYPRGCRIRRVRVPASKAGDGGDSVGPVILSRRALADRREQTV
jgi:hypothetical protein